MLHINEAIVKHNNTVLDRVTASAVLNNSNNAVTESNQLQTMLHINKAIIKHNTTVLDKVTASAWLKCKNAVTLGLIQPHGMAKGSQRLADGLLAVTMIAADGAELLLQPHGGTLDALRRWLAAHAGDECCGGSSSILLKGLNSAPRRRMLLADDRAEPAVPRFAQVVRAVVTIDGRLKHVPHRRREQRWQVPDDWRRDALI